MFLKSTYISCKCCAAFKSTPPATCRNFTNVLKGDISHLFPHLLCYYCLFEEILSTWGKWKQMCPFLSVFQAHKYMAILICIIYIMKLMTADYRHKFYLEITHELHTNSGLFPKTVACLIYARFWTWNYVHSCIFFLSNISSSEEQY